MPKSRVRKKVRQQKAYSPKKKQPGLSRKDIHILQRNIATLEKAEQDELAKQRRNEEPVVELEDGNLSLGPFTAEKENQDGGEGSRQEDKG